MNSGAPADLAATYTNGAITQQTGMYANAVPDVVGPFNFNKGTVRWNGPTTTAGVKTGTYFNEPSPFMKVDDPQCAITNRADRMGFNLYANGSCTIDALADAKTGQILLQNPLPGRRGNLGQNRMRNPGGWDFDANLSKAFRLTESKTMEVRVDATNVLNHPNPNGPQFGLNATTVIATISGKGNQTRQFQARLRLNF